jgi:hypothetical protein
MLSREAILSILFVVGRTRVRSADHARGAGLVPKALLPPRGCRATAGKAVIAVRRWAG